MKKDFIDTNEFTKQELLDIIDLSLAIKKAIQGVRLLEERAFRGAVTDAVLAAYEKTKDLGKK